MLKLDAAQDKDGAIDSVLTTIIADTQFAAYKPALEFWQDSIQEEVDLKTRIHHKSLEATATNRSRTFIDRINVLRFIPVLCATYIYAMVSVDKGISEFGGNGTVALLPPESYLQHLSGNVSAPYFQMLGVNDQWNGTISLVLSSTSAPNNAPAYFMNTFLFVLSAHYIFPFIHHIHYLAKRYLLSDENIEVSNMKMEDIVYGQIKALPIENQESVISAVCNFLPTVLLSRSIYFTREGRFKQFIPSLDFYKDLSLKVESLVSDYKKVDI